MVTQYVPGGGGRQAANQVYRAAADGLTIGACSPGVLSSAVLGEPGVEYDPYKFIYLGSPFSENINMFATRKALGINSLEKLRASSGIRIGAQSVGHVQYIRGRLFAWLLDVKEPRFVVGYSGTELEIALERGEARDASDNVGHTDADGVLAKISSISMPFWRIPKDVVLLNLPICLTSNLSCAPAWRADSWPWRGLFGASERSSICRRAHRRPPRSSGKPFAILSRSPISRTIQKSHWSLSDAADGRGTAETCCDAAAGQRGH